VSNTYQKIRSIIREEVKNLLRESKLLDQIKDEFNYERDFLTHRTNSSLVVTDQSGEHEVRVVDESGVLKVISKKLRNIDFAEMVKNKIEEFGYPATVSRR